MSKIEELIQVNEIIVNKLFNQRKNGEFCDIRLIIGKHQTWVHSSIVCSVSSYIYEEYIKRLETKSTSKHTLPFVKININESTNLDCIECLEKLIDFIYGNKLILKEDHTTHLLNYCKDFNITDSIYDIVYKNIGCKDKTNLKNEIKLESKENLENQTNLEIEIKIEPIGNANKHETKVELSSSRSDDDDNSFSDALSENCTQRMSPLSTVQKEEYFNFPIAKAQRCVQCSFKCYKSVELLKHLLETCHGGNVCSLCATVIETDQNLKDHLHLHDHSKPYFCTYCDLRFQSRSLLGQHLPMHSMRKPYTCRYCQKSFKRKHTLNSHLIIHSDEKKHLCDECGFSTVHARLLRAHKLTHSGNLFKCSFPGCEQTSTRKENMKRHVDTHSNKKPFICELCGHKFSLNKSLKRHSLIHSQQELDNACPHCSFKARRVDNLKAHILRQHSRNKKIDLFHSSEFTSNNT